MPSRRCLQAACLSRVGIRRIASVEAGVADAVVVAGAAMAAEMAAIGDQIAVRSEPRLKPPTEFRIENRSRGLRVRPSLLLRAQIPVESSLRGRRPDTSRSCYQGNPYLSISAWRRPRPRRTRQY